MKNLSKRKKFISSYNLIENCNFKNIHIKDLNFKINVKSENRLSESNIIKAQKLLLLKILFIKSVFKKKDTANFHILLNIKSDDLDNIMKILNKFSSKSITESENKIQIYLKNSVLEFENLNFQKINQESFSNITISCRINSYNPFLNKLILNETFLKE